MVISVNQTDFFYRRHDFIKQTIIALKKQKMTKNEKPTLHNVFMQGEKYVKWKPF